MEQARATALFFIAMIILISWLVYTPTIDTPHKLKKQLKFETNDIRYGARGIVFTLPPTVIMPVPNCSPPNMWAGTQLSIT